MRPNWESDLQQLETGLVPALRALPAPTPDTALAERVWAGLMTGSPAIQRRRVDLRRWLRLPRPALIAAALLLVLAGGWFGSTVWPPGVDPALGPLLLPAAQAAVGQLGDLTFRLGLQNQLGNLNWQLDAALPSLPGELPVLRMVHPQLTAEDALQLASRLGIRSAKLSEQWSGAMALVSGQNGHLWLDLSRGSWQYEASGPTAGDLPTAQSASAAAVDWLQAAGVLAGEELAIQVQPDDPLYWVEVRLASGPGGYPVVSHSPGYRVLVARGDQVIAADGAWPLAEASLDLPVGSYRQALQALQQGQGEFAAAGFTPYGSGTARITGASLGYQLAYALDYTPYLVPVAVFSGEYQPNSGQLSQFSAYVNLLSPARRDNAGGWRLQVALPPAIESAAVIKERPLAVSQSQLPALRQFFGLAAAQPDEYGTWRLGQSELGATSWDGGWLWRGTWQSPAAVPGPVNPVQATEIARDLLSRLPGLPGVAGDPAVSGTAADGFYWVSFPFSYGGLGIDTLGAPAESRLAVQVNQSNGLVTAVNCAKPMQLQTERLRLITPEQAWSRLEHNQAVVALDGWLERLPAERFLAEQSLVTAVELVYVPRDPAFARNEFYDLKYIFRGTTWVGEREISFSAIVDATR